MQLVWQSGPVDPLADIVNAIRGALSSPSETFERPEPSPLTLVRSRLIGQPWKGSPAAKLRRVVWKLTDEQLPVVAHWLDQHEAALTTNSATAIALRHVSFQWRPELREEQPELASPMTFGVAFSRPRHIQIPFQFYSVGHYRMIKRYMGDIGLASLIDRCVMPKGSLVGGTPGGAA
ncbi:MAG TPA: hypothetical protein VF796_20850 [Humisphaera sp.]